MVMQNSMMKYMTSIGQKTGTLKASKNVQIIAMTMPLVAECQNLNSGNLRMKGLNSSFCFVGKAGPSSGSSNSDGSTFGDRNAMNRLRW
uniref:Uncharacterized protein n=1 Tax=Anguilla anguilla TaxID=7936 RepID=A0A0E9XEP0_ANGAN